MRSELLDGWLLPGLPESCKSAASLMRRSLWLSSGVLHLGIFVFLLSLSRPVIPNESLPRLMPRIFMMISEENRCMDLLQRMRVIGSGLVIAAYFITLHLDVVTGVIVHLAAMTISVPYFIKSKAWDVVIMMTFLMTIGSGRLVTAAMP